MIAQLSHIDPARSPSSSIIGVRCAGSFARNSGSRRLAPDVLLLEVEPGGAHKMRAREVVDARLAGC